MNRSTIARLGRIEAAIAPAGRTHCIFSEDEGVAEAEIAAKRESGEIGPQDRVFVISWRSARANEKTGKYD